MGNLLCSLAPIKIPEEKHLVMKFNLITKTCLQISVVSLWLTSSASNAENNQGFNQKLSLQGISFEVNCPNQGSINKLTITPSGLEIDNSVIEKEIDGAVTGTEISDLNGDGSPEIIVYVSSAGSGTYGSVVAYSANNNKSLTEIYLPPLADDPEYSVGYMGHDNFAVVENSLSRRFPVYKPGDSNANPTGGTRQVDYKLIPGEAGWIFKPYQSNEY